MSKTEVVLSESTKEYVVLEGDALKFYRYFTEINIYDGQPKDPIYYDKLIKLGYTYSQHQTIFHHQGYPPFVKHIVDYNVPPAMAVYAKDYLRSTGMLYSYPSSWFGSALSIARVDDCQDLEAKGWDTIFAIIGAAFPHRQERLQQIIDYDLQLDGYTFNEYDVPMISRIVKLPGASSQNIINFLDRGYTESELRAYGFMLTKWFSPQEIRNSTSSPKIMRRVFATFRDNVKNSSPSNPNPSKYFVPSMMQLEDIIASGIETEKDYKEMAKMFGLSTYDRDVADIIPMALKSLTYDDCLNLFLHTGSLHIEEVSAIGHMVASGRTVEDYLEIHASVDPKTELKKMLSLSPAVNALRLLEKGMTPADIAQASSAGVPVSEM